MRAFFYLLCLLVVGILPTSYAYIPITYNVTRYAGTPPQVSFTPTTITASDDEVYPVTIPFGFVFAGTSYSTLNIGSNGNIQFTTSSTSYSPTALPNPAIAAPFIAFFWSGNDLITHASSLKRFLNVLIVV